MGPTICNCSGCANHPKHEEADEAFWKWRFREKPEPVFPAEVECFRPAISQHNTVQCGAYHYEAGKAKVAEQEPQP